jgi:putative transposase
MIKGFKVKLKVNNKQITQLVACVNTARFAYNWSLNWQNIYYTNHPTTDVIYLDVMYKEFTEYKKTIAPWLYNFSIGITKRAIKDSYIVYTQYKKGVCNKPNFKKKYKAKLSFGETRVEFTNTHVKLPKILKIKLTEFNRIPIDVVYYNPRIIFDGVSWWVSVSLKVDQNIPIKESCEPIGVDLGITYLATISNGKIYDNINRSNRLKKYIKKRKRLQKRASKYQLLKSVSKRHIKLKKCIRIAYHNITNLRINYLHQVTTELVKTKPEYIVIEDLNIKGMIKNKYVSRALGEQCLSEFRAQLIYKCLWNNILLVIANRFFPSSKLCSNCGSIKNILKHNIRTYICEHCGNVIDRDLNAAINLRDYPYYIKKNTDSLVGNSSPWSVISNESKLRLKSDAVNWEKNVEPIFI